MAGRKILILVGDFPGQKNGVSQPVEGLLLPGATYSCSHGSGVCPKIWNPKNLVVNRQLE